MAKKAHNIDHDTFNERLSEAKDSSAKAQELARDLGIKDRSKLNHEQLIDAITQVEPKD